MGVGGFTGTAGGDIELVDLVDIDNRDCAGPGGEAWARSGLLTIAAKDSLLVGNLSVIRLDGAGFGTAGDCLRGLAGCACCACCANCVNEGGLDEVGDRSCDCGCTIVGGRRTGTAAGAATVAAL